MSTSLRVFQHACKISCGKKANSLLSNSLPSNSHHMARITIIEKKQYTLSAFISRFILLCDRRGVSFCVINLKRSRTLLQENRHNVNQTHALKGCWIYPSGISLFRGPVSVSTTALLNMFATSWAISLLYTSIDDIAQYRMASVTNPLVL